MCTHGAILFRTLNSPPRPSADSAAGAKKSFQESCERMGLSSLHTLRIHDPDSIEGVWDQAIQGAYCIPPPASLRLL